MYKFKDESELRKWIKENVFTSAEARSYLGVSRASMKGYIDRGKLTPIKEMSRDKLFLKCDLDHRKEQSEKLRPKYRPYEEK